MLRTPSPPIDPVLDLRRQRRLLGRAFTALIVALGPAAAAGACGPSTPENPPPGGDAGPLAEAGADAPASPDADAGEIPDALADRNCMVNISIEDAGIDVDPPCTYEVPCGLGPSLTVKGCEVISTVDGLSTGCTIIEGGGCEADVFVPGPGGALKMRCIDCLGGGGRMPAGLAPAAATFAPTAVGAYFARMAHDEAASVIAFRRLRDDLARIGAPAALVSAAERSARDEERHARVMRRRARSLSASIPAPRVGPRRRRGIEAIARENAVEGCVRETFGALILRWQAERARDPATRRSLARIAADEARHAALSWTIARWIEPRLDAAARGRVMAARSRAIEEIRREARARSFDEQVGRPAPTQRAALLEGMIARLSLA